MVSQTVVLREFGVPQSAQAYGRRGYGVSRSVRTSVAVSDTPTHGLGSELESSFLINHLRLSGAHRFWYEGSLYCRCEGNRPTRSRPRATKSPPPHPRPPHRPPRCHLASIDTSPS